MMRRRHDVWWYHAVAVFLGVSIPSRENEGCIPARAGEVILDGRYIACREGGLINASCRVTEKVLGIGSLARACLCPVEWNQIGVASSS